MKFALGLALLLALGAPAFAIDTTDNLHFDFGLRIGAVGGTVSTTEFDADLNRDITSRSNFGGFSFGVGANFDLTRWLSLNGTVHLLLDTFLFQVTRKGLDITAAFYILGGSRRTMMVTDDMVLMARDPYGLAILLRPSFASYTLNPNSTSKIDAALLGLDVGAEFRLEISDTSGLTFALLYSGLSVPASGTRLKAALITIEAAYRVFL